VGAQDRPGIIHRLDKDTSGLMIIPRTHHAYNTFGSLFRNRTIHKTYYALVQGHPPKEGFIDLSIGRHPHIRVKMATFDKEKTAHYIKKGYRIRTAFTHYRVIKYFTDYALVEFKPTTGRTHQIRVHASAIGHPIIGDETYGSSSVLIQRQALHAAKLQFQFDNEQFSFSINLPDDISICVT
jgi:23S rRNA pseudouridine1911/1915/1917 synthase